MYPLRNVMRLDLLKSVRIVSVPPLCTGVQNVCSALVTDC